MACREKDRSTARTEVRLPMPSVARDIRSEGLGWLRRRALLGISGPLHRPAGPSSDPRFSVRYLVALATATAGSRRRAALPKTSLLGHANAPVSARKRARVAQEPLGGDEIVVEQLVVADTEGESREVGDLGVRHDDGPPEIEVPQAVIQKALVEQHVDRRRLQSP